VNPSFSIQTGEARSRGIEFDLSGEITPRWSITAASAFTDTESTQDNSGREGFRVEAVPEHRAVSGRATGFSRDPCRA
jgi:iron complex outermembrane receptor protein